MSRSTTQYTCATTIAFGCAIAAFALIAVIYGSSSGSFDQPKVDLVAHFSNSLPLADSNQLMGRQETQARLGQGTEAHRGLTVAAALKANQELVRAGFDIHQEGSDCPLQLQFKVEMHPSNADAPYRRHLVDIAAHQEVEGGQGNGNPYSEFKIPNVIIQVQSEDTVPVGMRAAMQSLMDSNPLLEHRYFSDRSARTWLEAHGEGSQFRVFEALIPSRLRANFFVLCYLYKMGGIYMDAGFHASNLSFSQDFLQKDDEFVGILQDNGLLSFELIAVTPQHSMLRQAITSASDLIQRHAYGRSVEDVAGTEVLTEAFRTHLGVPKQRALSPGLQGGERIRLLKLNRRPDCLIGALRTGGGTTGEPVLWTRYPTYGRETRWYRLTSDDAEAAWSKHHLYAEGNCPFGLTLAQENDKINQAPERNRVLVDMSPYHPAIKSVTEKQKIPRIIMQTNKADRVPKDLRKNMQKMIDVNPDYEHYYFSDRRIRDFIKHHLDQRTLDAFDAVIPGAYKSDLFRYCFLYIKGGVFLDGDILAARPLQELLRHDDEFVSAEDCGIGWVHNAFMAAVPGHAIVKKAIDMCVDRITRRDYGENPLAISGPILLRDAFKTVTGQGVRVGGYSGNVRLLPYTRQGHCMVGQIKEHGRVVLWMRYDTYKSETRWYMAGKSYYHDMWNERRVFADGAKPSKKKKGSNRSPPPPPGRPSGRSPSSIRNRDLYQRKRKQ